MIDADTIGRLIVNVGRNGFDAAFFALGRRTLDISSCSAFSFEDTSKACSVVLDGLGVEQREKTRSLGSSYVAGGFHSDPLVRDLFSVTNVEVRLVNPAAIGNVDFRGRYYEQPQIASEIAVLGCYGQRHYNIGFYRDVEKEPFGPEAIALGKALAQVALPALHRHLDLLLADPQREETQPSPGQPTKETHDHLSAVLLAEGHGLSPREAQVCAAIILGYRTLAISLNLGISENTICTHRKRAYAKLKISSQNELFSRYFRTVAGLRNSNGQRHEERQMAVV